MKQMPLVGLSGLRNPIVEAWQRCSREERLDFLECCEFDLAKLRRQRDGEQIEIAAAEHDARSTERHVSSMTVPRLAVSADEPEFLRLFDEMAAETGIEDPNRHKILVQFERALRRDRCALVVMGQPDHLRGFLLLGYSYPWWGDGARMMPLSMFVEPDHAQSGAAHALLKFSRQPGSRLEGALDQLMIA